MNTDMMKEGAFRMFTQANLFLLLLLAIALVAKNQSLLFAVGFLIVIKAVGLDQKLFPVIQSKLKRSILTALIEPRPPS